MRTVGYIGAFKYAQHIKVVKHQLYTIVTLVDPWQEGKTLHTYVLVPKNVNLIRCLPPV